MSATPKVPARSSGWTSPGSCKPGAENLVAIKVCDFPKVRLDGMYEWQELSMIWSGVYRPVCLEITDEVSLIDEYIQPRLAQSKADVSFALSHPSPSPLRVVLKAMDGKRTLGSAEVTLAGGSDRGQRGGEARQVHHVVSDPSQALHDGDADLPRGREAAH